MSETERKLHTLKDCKACSQIMIKLFKDPAAENSREREIYFVKPKGNQRNDTRKLQ